MFELEDALIENSALNSETIDWIVDQAPNECVLTGALKNPACSPDTLAKVVWLSDFKHLPLAEKHENFSSDALDKLLEEKSSDENIDERAKVAGYEKSPQHLLQRLAEDKSMEVRKHLAANPRCPLNCLYKLQFDLFAEVQRTALANPNHPEVLAKNKENFWKLSSLLKNPSTPTVVLRQFSNHDELGFRQAIALNPECPDEILRELLYDPEIRVRIAAKHRIEK